MASPKEAALKRADKKAEKELLRTLAELGGRKNDDDDIVFAGTKLTIPTSMGTIRRAIDFLERKEEEMETETDFVKVFNYRPWDGAYCMWNAFKRVFGAVAHKGTPGFFFFPGDPPRMITVPVDVNKTAQVPWGNFELPALPGVSFSTFQSDHVELGPLFGITATGPKKFAAEIEGVWKLIDDELKTNSMYRGKAFDGQPMPEFVDLSGVDPSKVVYSEETMTELEAHIWAQLRHTGAFEKAGFSLKRAVLLHGTYGTGKTLAAMLTAKEAVANGWTFIKGRPARDDLGFVMQTAKLYQPAVVFYEDVDQLADAETTSEESLARLLDDFDGIDAKGTRMLVVLTTNHPERIQQGMARPGRLDALIPIGKLDLPGLRKLVEAHVGDQLADDIDWEQVMEAADGYTPAFVTEFAGRVWRYAAVRTEGDTEHVTFVTDDLVKAALGLRPQYELMTGAKARHEKPRLEQALGRVVKDVVQDTLDPRVLVEANGDN
jgi:transitional endoplasmic reticulum ATPase